MGEAKALSGWIKSVGVRLATWMETRADHWAAAVMYQQVSALSDAELTQRGLSRATRKLRTRTLLRVLTAEYGTKSASSSTQQFSQLLKVLQTR